MASTFAGLVYRPRLRTSPAEAALFFRPAGSLDIDIINIDINIIIIIISYLSLLTLLLLLLLRQGSGPVGPREVASATLRPLRAGAA